MAGSRTYRKRPAKLSITHKSGGQIGLLSNVLDGCDQAATSADRPGALYFHCKFHFEAALWSRVSARGLGNLNLCEPLRPLR